MLLRGIEGAYAVAQLPPDMGAPGWFDGAGSSAFVKAKDEIALVCDESRVPKGLYSNRVSDLFYGIWPFYLDETGIFASLICQISADDIRDLVVCTFDGEHILSPRESLGRVGKLLS